MTPTPCAAKTRRALAAFLSACSIGAMRPASAQTPTPTTAQQPVSSTAEEPTVTLEQAVELAWQHSPALAQREGAVTTSRSAERVQIGSFLPNLSFSSGASLASTERFNPQTNTTVSGSNDSYSAGLSASVDLFTAGRRGAQLRQARANTDAALASVVEQRFAVALQAKQSFFDVRRADELIRVAEARVMRAQQSEQAAQRRMQVGSGTRSDVLRAQLEANQARQALLQAQSQRRAATYALGALIGADGPVAAQPGEEVVPAPLALTDEELIELVERQSPVVQTDRKSVV